VVSKGLKGDRTMQDRILRSTRIALVIAALVVTSMPFPTGARAAGSETVSLNVEGMWAEGCEEYISDSLLGDIEGIQQVHADHENDVVTVEFDPAESSAEQIAAAIEDCPLFDVTGSETHELDEQLIKKNRRSCCHLGCRNRDV
jgi:copper chaperone CopZ